jgi:hypothetical protein
VSRGRIAIAAAVAVTGAVAAGSAAKALVGDRFGVCRGAEALTEPPRVYRLGPLRVGLGPKGSFEEGRPHKVGVVPWPDGRTPLRATLTVTGFDCADRKPLRFAFRSNEIPFGRRLSVRELQTIADRAAVFRPIEYCPTKGCGYTGFMLFWARGKYRLEARERNELIDTLVVDIS